jgi:hypothetical protein
MGNLGRMEKLLPPLLGLLSMGLSQVSSDSTARGMFTGSATAPNTWKIRRPARSLEWTKVYPIYMLLMFTSQVPRVIPGYFIHDLLLTFVTLGRCYVISGAWQRTK